MLFVVILHLPSFQHFAAHQCILMAASEVFEEMFHYAQQQQQNLQNHLLIKVPDVQAGAFQVMLNYIYAIDIQQLKWANLFGVFCAGKNSL